MARIFVGCEVSQTVVRAFRARGHEAFSCDISPTDGNPDWHFQTDLFNAIDDSYDLYIFHPPCTYLSNSGVCHLWITPYKDAPKKILNSERWIQMVDGAHFFKRILDLPYTKICIENPIPHGYAIEKIGQKYTQIIHPWMFGHMEQKATCLWLKGLPKLVETDNVKEQMLALPKKERERLHYLSPGPNRAKERAKTYDGIGQAMAMQWGPLL